MKVCKACKHKLSATCQKKFIITYYEHYGLHPALHTSLTEQQGTVPYLNNVHKIVSPMANAKTIMLYEIHVTTTIHTYCST